MNEANTAIKETINKAITKIIQSLEQNYCDFHVWASDLGRI